MHPAVSGHWDGHYSSGIHIKEHSSRPLKKTCCRRSEQRERLKEGLMKLQFRSQGLKLIQLWGNIDMMVECMVPMGVQVVAFMKSCNTISNSVKVLQLLIFLFPIHHDNRLPVFCR